MDRLKTQHKNAISKRKQKKITQNTPALNNTQQHLVPPSAFLLAQSNRHCEKNETNCERLLASPALTDLPTNMQTRNEREFAKYNEEHSACRSKYSFVQKKRSTANSITENSLCRHTITAVLRWSNERCWKPEWQEKL